MLFPIPSFKLLLNRHFGVKLLAQVNFVIGVRFLIDPMQILLSHEYGRNFCPKETAHAQKEYQDNSTSGRGARASYQTMLPEISARRSLL